jgi:hypothetical protein
MAVMGDHTPGALNPIHNLSFLNKLNCVSDFHIYYLFVDVGIFYITSHTHGQYLSNISYGLNHVSLLQRLS